MPALKVSVTSIEPHLQIGSADVDVDAAGTTEVAGEYRPLGRKEGAAPAAVIGSNSTQMIPSQVTPLFAVNRSSRSIDPSKLQGTDTEHIPATLILLNEAGDTMLFDHPPWLDNALGLTQNQFSIQTPAATNR